MYQCGVGGVELGEDVARVAEHGGDHRPLGGQPLDDEAGNEDGGDDQEEVDHRQGGRAHAGNLEFGADMLKVLFGMFLRRRT